jgi:hypothetical protein
MARDSGAMRAEARRTLRLAQAVAAMFDSGAWAAEQEKLQRIMNTYE